jgi:hypothetical protein
MMMKIRQPTEEQLAIRCVDRVVRIGDDGNETIHTATSDPWKLGGGQWVVKLAGVSGGYDLCRCRKFQPPKTESLVHTFNHTASDGTVLEIEVNLNTLVPEIKTKTDMANVSEVARSEYPAWAQAVSEQVMPLLSNEQLDAMAVVGLKRLMR